MAINIFHGGGDFCRKRRTFRAPLSSILNAKEKNSTGHPGAIACPMLAFRYAAWTRPIRSAVNGSPQNNDG